MKPRQKEEPFYRFLFFRTARMSYLRSFLPVPARPIKPMPSRSIVAGSGTGAARAVIDPVDSRLQSAGWPKSSESKRGFSEYVGKEPVAIPSPEAGAFTFNTSLTAATGPFGSLAPRPEAPLSRTCSHCYCIRRRCCGFEYPAPNQRRRLHARPRHHRAPQ